MSSSYPFFLVFCLRVSLGLIGSPTCYGDCMKRITLAFVAVTLISLLPVGSASAYKVKSCEPFPVRAYFNLDYRAMKVKAHRVSCKRAKRLIKLTWVGDEPDSGTLNCHLRFGSRSSVFCSNGLSGKPSRYRWVRAAILVR